MKELVENNLKLSELLILAEFADKRGLFDLVEDKIWEDEKEVSHLLLAFLKEVRRKRVVRNKKMKFKAFCPKRMKYNASKKACVRVGSGEMVRRKRSQKRAALKRKAKGKRILRKRLKSLRVRKNLRM